MTVSKEGKVYLVGAGPGSPDLITLRGVRCLQVADVVLYDRLVRPELLRQVRTGARLIYVGKRRGHSEGQEWIQRLAIAEARKGQTVVRLKGGDPYVFGRGGEEAEALANAGIDFEVVPGLTSAIAVPALAGIPVLHRGHSSALVIVSGHHCRQEEVRQWAGWLAQSATLVILMGVENFRRIVAALREAGVSDALPVSVTSNGATCRERTIEGTLGSIEALAEGIEAPAVIVMGQVVKLRQKLAGISWQPDTQKRRRAR
ncbi:MAG: uroporphyrinogen-III C-methyltransferase [Acidobacteria bacterium]|nr:uroporphyrinogen-III C-methyltransferase [Acidobacteriota bacterium]